MGSACDCYICLSLIIIYCIVLGADHGVLSGPGLAAGVKDCWNIGCCEKVLFWYYIGEIQTLGVVHKCYVRGMKWRVSLDTKYQL